MADKLVIFDHNYVYRIGWLLADDGEIGAWIGDSGDINDPEPDAESERGNWEHWTATQAVNRIKGVVRDSRGFYFDSKQEATAALRIAKAAMKQERPMPEWATKALAEGWTMPKGWKA